MGAEDFSVESEGDTVEEAFASARDQAAWDYGHAGYTGTIAEKPGAIEVSVPEGVDPYDFIKAIERSWSNIDWLVSMVGLAEAQRLTKLYEAKWDEALAVKVGERTWCFFGLASS